MNLNNLTIIYYFREYFYLFKILEYNIKKKILKIF